MARLSDAHISQFLAAHLADAPAPAEIERTLAQSSSVCVANDCAAAVACCAGETADLLWIAAAPVGCGHGRRMLTTLCDSLRVRGIVRVFAEVRASNAAALALYRAAGAQAVARRPHYYRAPVEDAVLCLINL